MTNFGAFVELDEGIEGLIHVSEFDDYAAAARRSSSKVGETYPMKIIKLEPGRAEDRPEHPRAEERRVPRRLGGVLGDDRATGTATLGDHFKQSSRRQA